MKQSQRNNIIQKIKSGEIHTESVWVSRLHEFSLWLFITVSFVLASISIGSFIFQIANNELLPNQKQYLFLGIKIFLILLFIFSIIFHVRRTRRGYKKTYVFYIVGAFVASSLFGGIFFGTNLSSYIDQKTGSAGILYHINDFWSNPEQNGVLAGKVKSWKAIDNSTILEIEKFNKEIQIINLKHIDENVADHIQTSNRIKMSGYIENNVFYPCSINDWNINHHYQNGPRDHHLSSYESASLANHLEGHKTKKQSDLQDASCKPTF